MAKKVHWQMKLQIKAGQANPSPPVGPALGQRGMNIMEFCKAFNAQTADLEPGPPCPVDHHLLHDKSFTMEIKTPPASFLLKKAAGLKPWASGTVEGLHAPGSDVAGSVTRGAGARDRRGQDEGPQRERHRSGDADHRWAPPGRWASR